jgi:hypothetical protein
MNKIIRYVTAYALWVIDLGLALWFIFFSRTVFLGVLASFAKEGDWQYRYKVDSADKIYVIALGLGWLAFMIFLEQYFRNGAGAGDLLKRFARATWPVLLGIFIVDVIFFWFQGLGVTAWLRWLVLAAELGIGIVLLVYEKSQSKSKPN